MIDLNQLSDYIARSDNLEHLDQLTDKLRTLLLQIRDRKEVLLIPTYHAQVLVDGVYCTVAKSIYPHKARQAIMKHVPQGADYYWLNDHTYVCRKDTYGDLPRARIVCVEVAKPKSTAV